MMDDYLFFHVDGTAEVPDWMVPCDIPPPLWARVEQAMRAEESDNVWADYLTREKAAQNTMQGADHKAILRAVAEAHGVTYEFARSVILDRTAIGGG